MFCTHCGNQLPEGAAFCTKCGWAVSSTPATPQTQTATINQPQIQTTPVSPTADTKSHKKFLIGFWVGLIGFPVLCFAVIVFLVAFNTALQKGGSAQMTQDVSPPTGDAAGNTEIPSGWHVYSPDDNSFSVYLPTTPSSSNGSGATNDGIPYVSKTYVSSPSQSIAYIITHFAYEQPLDTSDEALQAMVNATIDAGQRKLLSSQYLDFGPYRAVEVLVQNPSGTFTKSRFFFANDRDVFFLSEGYEEGSYSDSGYQNFVNSFHSNL